MARIPIPLVVDEDLFLSGHREALATFRVGSPDWHLWLSSAQTISFAFRSQNIIFTARCERQRNGWYWYAYRKRLNKTYKTYLGKSEELTHERLREVGQLLARRAGVSVQTDDAMIQQTNKSIHISSRAKNKMQAPILATRFTVPPAPMIRIARPHLLSNLDTASKGKLTLLSAPAGWGKTTLLGEWCEHLKKQKNISFIWISLDPHDATPETFWKTLMSACKTISPDLRHAGEKLINESQVTPMVILETLLHELHQCTEDIIIILDDSQYLPPEQQQELTFFINRLPSSLHLILAGRMDPPLPLARLRLQGQLQELNTTDLAFSVQETQALLQKILNRTISYDVCLQLTERTEGWIAGLHLALLGTANQHDTSTIAHSLTHFSGQERYVVNFVIEEILMLLPKDLQSFLIETSPLTVMNAQLCDAIRDSNTSQSYLDKLEQHHLCLVQTEQKKSHYRYPHLIREALQTRLHQCDTALETRIQTQASQWYEQQGLHNEALTYARAACSEGLITQLLKEKEQGFNTTIEKQTTPAIEPVTERERDVLSLLVEGASNREIAQQLIISEGTVKKHVSNICNKLGVRRRTQVITRALSLALL